MIEEWETEQHLNNLLRSELFTVLLGAKNLMSEPLKIKFNAVISKTGIEAVIEAFRKNKRIKSEK